MLLRFALVSIVILLVSCSKDQFSSPANISPEGHVWNNSANGVEVSRISVPNSFSPNNDGKNDFFQPDLFQITSYNYSFKVYNRWGEAMFSTTDPGQDWDGRFFFTGDYAPMAQYECVIFAEDSTGFVYNVRSDLLLLR